MKSVSTQEKINKSETVEQKSKIKEFSELIHTMRHDIRNFIAAIDGYAWLLKEEFNVDYVNRIINNIANITSVVDRSVALIDADLAIEKFTEIDLNDLVKSYTELLPELVELETTNLFKVKADYSKIHFLFKTIIENAIQHGEPKILEVHGLEPKEEHIIVQILNDGKRYLLKKQNNYLQKCHRV